MGSQRIESIAIFKSISYSKCINSLKQYINSDFNSSRDMATRTTTNYSGLPRRRGGVVASKPVAGVKMASKAGTKPVTANRAPLKTLNTQNGGKSAATTDTVNKKQLRTTKTAARRLL